MVHDGPWTEDQNDFIVAVRTKCPNLAWDKIRFEFMVEFDYQGEPVETSTKDISDRFHKTLKNEPHAIAYAAYLSTGVMDEEHQAFIEKAERIVARFNDAAQS